jgi:phenylpropionate dioxygenase-like ring-hydroxylating dioxygenase large terminal subunit
MGALLRRYWLPLMETSELGPPDGAPQRVRLLGEDLVVFRDTAGRIGLLAQACPHRGASLFFGRNEEDGLRCVYHGWKFDVAGRCVDMPTEPPGSLLAKGAGANAYPCRERQGIIWTYLGPCTNPPALPELGWSLVPPAQRGALKYRRDCNWLQALEGDIDTAHLGWLHARFGEDGEREVAFNAADRLRDVAVADTRPVLEVVDTAAGVMIGARREHGPSDHYWRVTQFLLPIFTSVPAIGSQRRAKVWVPLDDEDTLVWEPHWHPTEPLPEDERHGWKGRVPTSGMRSDDSGLPGSRVFVAQRDNDYFIDRGRQRSVNFSGLEESPPLQDGAIQESMGGDRRSEPRAPGHDRRRDHSRSAAAARGRHCSTRPWRRTAGGRRPRRLLSAWLADGSAPRRQLARSRSGGRYAGFDIERRSWQAAEKGCGMSNRRR